MYLNLWKLLLCLGALFLSITGCGLGNEADRVWNEDAAAAFLASYVSSNNFSGAVLVVRDGEALFEAGYGRADYELDVAVGTSTRFRIASVTKSFTAAAVMLLVDRGSVELDAPMNRYITEFPHGERVTVRTLLAHESGLPNYYYDLEDYPTLSRQAYDGPEDVVELVGGMELRFEPGARRAYNNMNFTALAWLIEEVTGLSYQDFLRQELLLPLGLEETGYRSDVHALVPNLAKGYDPVGRDGFQKSKYFDHSISVGAGSMYATARDLVRWSEALVEGALLSGSSREAAIEFAWGEQDIHGRAAFTAQGWDNVGYSAHLIHIPEEDLSVAVLCNLNIAQVVGEIANGLAAIALSEEPVRMQLAPRSLPVDSLQRLSGRYQFGEDFYSPGGMLDLVVQEGFLTDVGREPEASLIPLADGGFLYRPVWARVQFLSDDNGTVTGLRFYDQFVAQKLE